MAASGGGAGAAASTAIEIASIGIREIRRNVPVLEDKVTVEVIGQPGATKQELYFLALAAANGVVSNRAGLVNINPLLPPSIGLLQIEYDAADHWVRCTMAYSCGTAIGNVSPSNLMDGTVTLKSGAVGGVLGGFAQMALGMGKTPPAPGTPPFVVGSKDAFLTAGNLTSTFQLGDLALYNGPACEVIGGKFNFLSDVLPGIPDGTTAPTLPFQGQTILTACPTTVAPVPSALVTNAALSRPLVVRGSSTPILSPNPKPPGDNRSRGVVVTPGSGQATTGGCCVKQLSLVQMVFAALTDPGSTNEEVWVVPTPGPTGG